MTKETKRPIGRPLKFTDVPALEVSVDAYFADKKNEPFTLSGLAFHLNVCTESLRNYAHKPEFFCTIKKAKQRVEVYLMQLMLDKERPTGGCIFQAINNHGMTNKTETNHKSSDGSMSPVGVVERMIVSPKPSSDSPVVHT